MKKIAVLLFALSPLLLHAQNVKLDAGKKITASTTTSMDMDMSLGGQMKIETSSTNIIEVKSTEGNMYKAENTLVKLKMSQEGAGQEVSFDSDKKEDRESEMGKEISKELNVPGAIFIDKQTGEVKDVSPEKPVEDNENPFGDLMGQGSSPTASASAAFYVLPAGKKVGDQWIDSTSEKGMSIVKTYNYKSSENGISKLLINTTTKGTIKKSAQGTEFEITISGTGTTNLEADQKTGLTKRSATTSNMEGAVDMMGQSLPITMSMSSVTTFE